MSVPHYEIEFTLGTEYTFAFDAYVGSAEVDLTTWSNLWCMFKHNPEDEDAEGVIEKVFFAGVEPVTGDSNRAQVTILGTDAASLQDGKVHTLVGDVGGLDEEVKPRQLLTLSATARPRIRRSNS